MKVTGIISEYNPFHNGHRHHIRLARQRTGADVIVVIMNGNFVQRGECAVTDKYLRAKMALLGGADYVFELPVRYGLSSAADFAYGGVLALHSLGCVDALCFGCESPGENLQSMAEIFWNCQRKPEENQRVQAFLREGNSFPVARQRYLQEKTGWSEEECRQLFQPGNILATEYIQALWELSSPMKIVPILREGMGYHQVEASNEKEREYMSATAIRSRLSGGLEHLPGMPKEALEIWKQADYYMKTEDFWPLLALTIRMRNRELTQYKDISPELAKVFEREVSRASSYQQFIHGCKTKNITMSRIKRGMFQILFEIKEAPREERMPYLRLLGRRKDAVRLPLGEAQTQVLGRLAKEKENLELAAKEKLSQDIFAADIYRMTLSQKKGIVQKNEYESPMIII
ncbi:MAG: nucleotidyltransferase family protein [Eubacterium sp.]|nr:nucleotidyltransferase family protein [Eubacterium sp.]